MVGLCRLCAYEKSDCKGMQDLEKLHCEYYKKPTVFNAREAAERIADLEKQVKDLETRLDEIVNFVGRYLNTNGH